MLDASDPEAQVDLEVSEIVEDEASLRALHIDLAFMLLHKVDVYERVFKALSERESDVRDRYNRQRARAQLETLDAAASPQQRGDALEQLMAVIFSLPPELEVRERNYRSANEEIDIVLKNNVPRPFWQALNSPLIFVECKNWQQKIKADVVNRFERKLKNHAPQARVGILVAPKGFTAGARAAIRDGAKESVLIVPVERADLDALAKDGRSILDWMENLLSRPV
jgi:Holliday junction resolvase-like predicted endonuclease